MGIFDIIECTLGSLQYINTTIYFDCFVSSCKENWIQWRVDHLSNSDTGTPRLAIILLATVLGFLQGDVLIDINDSHYLTYSISGVGTGTVKYPSGMIANFTYVKGFNNLG